MTFKKETEKIVSLQMKGLVHFYHPPVILFERGKKYCRAAILWKGTNWKFIFLWRKINWHGSQIAKCHFSYMIWLMISEKSIIVLTLLLHHHDACMYQKSLSKQGIHKKLFTRISNCLNTYIHTERKNLKTFRKENYTIGLSSCYLLNFEHGTEHDIDSAYGVYMH